MHTPRSTLHMWINNGITLLNLAADTLIEWPNPKQCAINSAEFRSMSEINGAIGAVDCSHIAILPREDERMAYTNRKCFYSVHLPAVVDARGRFTFVDVGCAGSMADTTVLRSSMLASEQVQMVRMQQSPPIPFGYFLLADAGFATMPWVVQNYTDVQCTASLGCRKFNHCIARGRGIVERAYGQLKMRFKRLGGRTSYDRKEQVVRYVRACCALHNLNIIMEGELFSVSRVQRSAEVLQPVAGVAALQFAHTVPSDGAYIGSDKNMRLAGQAVRRLIANDALAARGYDLEAEF